LLDQWKESIIVPVYTKGEKTDCYNRPNSDRGRKWTQSPHTPEKLKKKGILIDGDKLRLPKQIEHRGFTRVALLGHKRFNQLQFGLLRSATC
jgi:hypothetical protein